MNILTQPGIHHWGSRLGLPVVRSTIYCHRSTDTELIPRASELPVSPRYGKQAIYAAAFDERFQCVVARSSGSPTACAYRFSRSADVHGVSPRRSEVWLTDKVRTYFGREHELPIEGNALLACIAPRHLMIDTTFNDGSDPPSALNAAT
jgi:hypothetical protein